MSISRVLNSINAFAVDTKQSIKLIDINGNVVHISHSEKVLSLVQKIQNQLEGCKEDNGLASELYEFSADLSKQLIHLKTHQNPCKRQN